MLRSYTPRVARAKKGVPNVKSDNRCDNNGNNMGESE